ncbi:MAG: glucosaminidase domain-containing protein [Saprospiraceae bacterium]|nr:glucosaminidase domain-containing protein [Saprospiraceae bacterium]
MQNKKRFLQKYQGSQNYYLSQFKMFLTNNWQKLALLLLIILVFSYKDLTIHFDLSSPFGTKDDSPPTIEEQFPNGSQGTINQGFTEQMQKDSRNEAFSLFPFIFGGKDKSENKVPKTLESAYNEVKKSKKTAYIKRFSHVAVEEMKEFGIPASITLAQALLHGQAGTGDLSTKANNHFSITCGSSWTEKTYEIQGICYRFYPSSWQGFRDHSELITKGRFTDLKQYSSTDYKKWAVGLQEKAYSTDKGYAELLMKIIKDFNLDRFDE